MEALIGTVLTVVIIFSSLRIIKFGIRMVGKLFDWIEDRF